MEKGYLQANSHILYAKRKHTLMMIPHNEEEIIIAKQQIAPASVIAYFCRDCDKFILNGSDMINR